MVVIFARLGCLDLTGLITVYSMTPALSRDGEDTVRVVHDTPGQSEHFHATC